MSTALTISEDARPSLVGLDRDGLRAALSGIGVPEKQLRMRASQLFNWLYFFGASEWDQMTNISKEMRATLAQHFTLDRPEEASKQVSEDGTRKYLLRVGEGHLVESVFIPEEGRGTLCVSSQVGCTLTCKFCHTGTQRLVRNLTAQEILQQVIVARDDLGEWPSPPEGRLVSNIVLMGMGEPLYNFEAVRDAMKMVMDPEGISLSRRRITLSTSGVVPMIDRCGEELGVNLAISLHAVRDAVRDEIMPINKKYPLDQLLRACANYPGASNARRITFEYVMLKGINDSLDDAKELVRLLKAYDIPGKVNLIPFNPWPGSIYECSDWDQIEKFSDTIFGKGISAPIRMPRGRDILAACGQLKSETEKLSRAERDRAGA